MFDGFIGSGADYLGFRGDSAGGAAEYEAFTLAEVLVREKFAACENSVGESEAVLYFISGRSLCYAADGGECPLPKPRTGDLCRLHAGSAAEITLRVAEAGYFIGRGNIEYIRLKLK